MKENTDWLIINEQMHEKNDNHKKILLNLSYTKHYATLLLFQFFSASWMYSGPPRSRLWPRNWNEETYFLSLFLNLNILKCYFWQTPLMISITGETDCGFLNFKFLTGTV